MRPSNIVKSAVFKLTLYYLAIIVGLSIGFSSFLYEISNNALGRSLRSPGFDNFSLFVPNYEQFRQGRLDEARGNLLFNLIVFNLFVLLAGGFLSYALAQRTLAPIDEALESQSRFTADASHELRTPLTAMQTEIEVALRRKDLSAPQAKKLLQSNLEEVSKLRSLSENLLKLASNGDQGLSLKVVSLEDISIDAVTSAVKAAQAKNIAIENNVQPVKVEADKAALSEVLNILLDNAIKYSPAKSTVTLASRQDNHNVILTVADQGRGIGKSDLPHIFERFYRSDHSRNKTQQTEGYGLGLSIAQRIIALHGGVITASSQPNKGSIFSVSLPTKK
jgi:two-component system sensor histidine kinase CiaH